MSLWALLAFPKLVLRGTGDPKNHPGKDAAHVVADRLDHWENGRFDTLWKELTQEETRTSAARPQTRAQAKQRKGTDPKLVDAMRALVAEGAP